MSPLSSSSTFSLHSYLIPIDSLYTAIKSQCQEVFLILFSLQQSGSGVSVCISLPWCKLRLCFFKKTWDAKKIPAVASILWWSFCLCCCHWHCCGQCYYCLLLLFFILLFTSQEYLLWLKTLLLPPPFCCWCHFCYSCCQRSSWSLLLLAFLLLSGLLML